LWLAVAYRPPQSTANDDNELIDSLYDICSTTSPIIVTVLYSRESVLDLILSSGTTIENIDILPPLGNSDHNIIVTNFPYFLYRLDRKERRGGGVCCLVRGNLHVHSVDRASPNKADVLCVDLLCPHNASRIRFILVYRPPNMSKNEDEELIDVLRDTVATHTNTIMLGDFILLVDWKALNAHNAASSLFLKFFQGSGLEQHVSLPTHGRNILDLVLSTFNNIREVTTSSPLANSDHSLFVSKYWETSRVTPLSLFPTS
ncbi:hypothetical protein COOONC_01242, partial [Cooperia oncophora]